MVHCPCKMQLNCSYFARWSVHMNHETHILVHFVKRGSVINKYIYFKEASWRNASWNYCHNLNANCAALREKVMEIRHNMCAKMFESVPAWLVWVLEYVIPICNEKSGISFGFPEGEKTKKEKKGFSMPCQDGFCCPLVKKPIDRGSDSWWQPGAWCQTNILIHMSMWTAGHKLQTLTLWSSIRARESACMMEEP